jgi:hypothetical protein
VTCVTVAAGGGARYSICNYWYGAEEVVHPSGLLAYFAGSPKLELPIEKELFQDSSDSPRDSVQNG